MALTKVTGGVVSPSSDYAINNVTGVAATFTGNVSIGGTLTYQDVSNIDAIGIITARSAVSIADSIVHTGNTDTSIRFPADDTFAVEIAGSEKLRIANSNLLLGHTASRDVFRETRVQISGNTGDSAGLSIYSTENGNAGPNLILGHSKNGNKVTDGTILGNITFVGHDNTDLNSRGSIIRSIMTADGSDNSLYADLLFFTKRNAGGYPEESLRIDSAGKLLIGITASTSSNAQIQSFKPTGNDSTIVVGNVATSASGLSRLDFAPSNSTVGARIECHATEDFASVANRTADLVFVTRKDGTNAEKLRIKSDGNIIPGTNNATSIGDGTTNFASIWASTRFRGNDNVKLILGNAQDLVIRHDGTNNIIGSPVGGDLHIKSGTGDNDNQLIASFKHSDASVGIGTVTVNTSNGAVGRKFGIFSSQNNVLVSETTSSSHGFLIEGRRTGRDTNKPRYAQIGLQQDGDGDGIIKFSTAADSDNITERVRIDSSGRVGINTDSFLTGEMLTIRGGAGDSGKFTFHSYASFLGASDAWEGYSALFRGAKAGNPNSQWIGIGATTANGWIDFANNSASKITITSTKVGIGSIIPEKTLDIVNTSSNADLRLKTTANSFNSIIMDSNRAADTQFAVIDGDWNGTTVNRIQFVTGSDGTNKDDGYMAFHTRESGQSLTERLKIDSSGNITAVNTASGGKSVTLSVGASNASGVNDGIIKIINGGTGNGVIQWDYETHVNRAQIYVYRSTQDLIFTTAGSERFRITSSGSLQSKGTGAIFEQVETNSYNGSWAAANGKIAIKGDLSGGNYFGWRQKGVASGSVTQANAEKKLPTINDFTYPNSSSGLLIASTSKIGFSASGESPQYATGVQMLFDSTGLAISGGNAFDCSDAVNTVAAKVKLRGSGKIELNSPAEQSGRLTIKGTNSNGSTCYAVTNSGKAKEGIDVTCTTVGANNYGGGISFGCGGNGRSAIAAIQTGADDDRNGLSFFTHGSSTGADNTTERLRIDAYGSLNIGNRLDQTDDLLHVNSFGMNKEAIGIGASSQGIRLGWEGDNSAYDSSRIYRTNYSTSAEFGMGSSWPCMVITPTTAPGSGTSNETLWLKSTGSGSGSTKMHLTVDGTTVIGGNGKVNGGTTSGYPQSRRAGFGDSKLTIQPDDRTSAFSAATGSTWHDVVIKQSGSATNNAVGIAFEVSTSGYHHNAGTGIAAVKNGTNSDYGCNLAFITRPQSSVASEKMRIHDSSGVSINSTAKYDNVDLYVSGGLSRLGNFFIGRVPGTSNNNTGVVLIGRVGLNFGMHFSGQITFNSYTGTGTRILDITTTWNDTSAPYAANAQGEMHSSGNVSRVNLKVCIGTVDGSVTESGSDETWLCLRKNGGGTGTSNINAFIQTNAYSHGGIREVAGSAFTQTQSIADFDS